MKYKNIVWDWNGTLLDDVEICQNTLNRMLERRSLRTVTLQQYKDIFGFPVRHYYETLGFDFNRDDWHEVSVDFVETYDSLAGEVRLTFGVVDVLHHIRQAGVRQYILSALKEDTLRRMVSNFGIADCFDGVCGSTNIYGESKIGRGKQMLTDCTICPEDTLMIGDTLHDAEVAEALGFDFRLYAGGHNSFWRLKEKGQVIVNMEELLELGNC